jgi:hypothetical protein
LIAQQSIQLGGVFGLFLAAGTVIRGGCWTNSYDLRL